jgi:SAM-dependent methyltransferase
LNNSGKPVSSADFWRTRINRTLAQGRDIHAAIFDTDDENWNRQQTQTKSILPKYVRPGEMLLDVGCGYGAVYECMPPNVIYTGIDLSPDLIQMALFRHPDVAFHVGDIKHLPYGTKSFDIVVCRSMRHMILENFVAGEWECMFQEIKRVTRRILFLEYGDPMLQEYMEC